MTNEQLYERVRYIYYQCSLIVKESLGTIPSTAGNVAIFCQSEDEFTSYKQLVDRLVIPSDNPAQKYFQLIEPIIIDAKSEVSATTLSWIYIRRPAEDSLESGDIDYILAQADYDKLKERVRSGGIKGASIYNRTGWDMIELRNESYDGLPYVTIRVMAEKIRVRF